MPKAKGAFLFSFIHTAASGGHSVFLREAP
jgi:hypothetical protein